MKKTYIIPNVLVVELGTRNHLMDVSYKNGVENLSSMDFDISDANAGSGQMTKESNSVWDNEW